MLVTTFGVGELSALCGVAGSLAERVPVLHIVGAPNTKMQSEHALLHHTLNTPGTFTTFSDMSKPLSCATATLNDVQPETRRTYADVFDDAVRACLTQCRPAYVELPMDVLHVKVSDEGLKHPLPRPSDPPPYGALRRTTLAGAQEPTNVLFQAERAPAYATSEEVTKTVVKEITKRFAAAKKPIVLVDACAARFGVGPHLKKLVDECGLRFFTTPMGKCVLDESSDLYGGCYAGQNLLPEVIKDVESADFVLYVGALKSDFNSGSFSVKIPEDYAIRLHSYTTEIGYASYPTTDIRHVVPALIPAFKEVVDKQGKPKSKRDTVAEKIDAGLCEKLYDAPLDPKGKITQAWLWGRMGSWIRENDIVICETGTSSFGLLSVPLPKGVTYVAQVLWGAIGWSVGAALGCVLASDEQKQDRRTVLFVGDGSLQLTVQEIGTMVRRGQKPYLFVLNNDGYEIERQIHGKHAKYNDIQPYDHQLLLPFLSGPKREQTESFKVKSQEELDRLLKDKDFSEPTKIRLIELDMPRDDAPEALIKQAQLTAKANAGDD